MLAGRCLRVMVPKSNFSKLWSGPEHSSILPMVLGTPCTVFPNPHWSILAHMWHSEHRPPLACRVHWIFKKARRERFCALGIAYISSPLRPHSSPPPYTLLLIPVGLLLTCSKISKGSPWLGGKRTEATRSQEAGFAS